MKYSTGKRAGALLLAVVLTLLMCPVVSAEETPAVPDTCPGCGLLLTELTYENWDSTTVFAENTITGDNHYRLTEDVTLTAQMTLTGPLVLDLNGYTMKAAENERCFDIQGGTLMLLDSSESKSGSLTGSDISGKDAADEACNGGTIRVKAGEFIMLGGTVRDGHGAQGGNIYCAAKTSLRIYGGTIRDGVAAGVGSSYGRGGNIYTQATTLITGDALIEGGIARYSEGNSGRGGNLFVHNRNTTVISGNAKIILGNAASRGGNILVNYNATLTIRDNAEIYGGTAKSAGSNIDVMTSTLNIAGGTIYGNPAGGAKNNISFYSTSSVLNITGGKTYGKIQTLVGMTINISGNPYVEHLYLPVELNKDGTEAGRALINPGKFDPSAWVGLEVEAEDKVFTAALEDFSSYLNFFNYTKEGLTWYRRKTDNALYLTKGTPCQCCGEDVNDIGWIPITADMVIQDMEGRVSTHYRLMENIQLLTPIAVDGTLGTVTIDLCGHTLTAPEGQSALNFVTGGKINIVDNSESKAGTILGCGEMHDDIGVLKIVGAGTEVNIYGGTITGGTAVGDNNYAGGVYLSDGAKLNMYNGNIVNNTAEDHGGNMFISGQSTFNFYGGLISGGMTLGGVAEGGAAFTGNGGNIYLTGRSFMNMYGGTITDGKNMKGAGGNIFVNSGAAFRMFDGIVENGAAARTAANLYVNSSSSGKYSSIEIYGGLVGLVDTSIAKVNSIASGSEENPFNIYNGTVLGQDVAAFLAACACYAYDGTTATVWNYGHIAGTCDSTCTMEDAWGKALVKTLQTGQHDFRLSGGAATCSLCGHTYYGENIVAMTEGRVYEDLHQALAETPVGGTVVLLADVTVDSLAVAEKGLNLNGYTLTANTFTSVIAGDVIDTSAGSTGKLVCPDVAFADTNSYLPVTFPDGIHFCAVGFTQWLERVDENTTKVKFYFTQRTEETIIDDALLAGNTQLEVSIRLSWVGSDGTAKEKTFLFSSELLQKYLEKWNSRVFVTTIDGVDKITDLQCTYQVSSTAGAGTTVSATTLNNVAEIREKLTWDAINGFALKHSTWTVDQMRDEVVAFMEFTKTYLWTPDETVSFDKNAKGSDDKMYQGTIYGGLPYVGVASGNVYRMMDYIDPATGLLDMKKAIPALGTKDHLDMSDMKYFGSQCSQSVYWGWGRVINSVDYQWTSSVVPRNGFILLGDVQVADVNAWTASYNTDMACAANGEQVIYGGYAEALRADGLVYYVETSGGNGAGHLVMVYEDAHVVYNADGTINGDESYLYIIDQAQSWETDTNESGDEYQRKNGVGTKMSF